MSRTVNDVVKENLDQPGGTFLRLRTHSGAYVKYTYREVVERGLRWKRYFETCLPPRSRIAIILPHSLDGYASYLGATLAGCQPAQVHFPSPKFSHARYERTAVPILRELGFAAIVSYAELTPILRAQIGGAPSPPMFIEAASIRLPDAAGVGSPHASSSSIAFLQFSSGTTGMKKGVAITHRQLLWQVETYSRNLAIDARDRIVSWLPLYHDLGLIACFWLPLLTRASLVAMSPFDWVRQPLLLLDAIAKHRSTLCWMPNFAYLHLCNAADAAGRAGRATLASMRAFVSGGEPVLASTMDRFCGTFGPAGVNRSMLWTIYGMAEAVLAATCTNAACLPPVDWIDRRRLNECGVAEPLAANDANGRCYVSCGPALDGVDVSIAGADGADLPERHIGEIVVRSPCGVTSYLDGAPAADPSIGCALRSGDLGYIAGGHLYVTGRKKDLIIVAGRNIHPEDVEQIVNGVEGIVPGRSVALGVDDASLGTQQLVVIAETRHSAQSIEDGIRNAIDEGIRAALDVAAGDIALVPAHWLEKSTSGKIARRANLEKYVNAKAAMVTDPSDDSRFHEPSLHELKLAIASVLPEYKRHRLLVLGEDEPLLGSGLLDSLRIVQALGAIENRFARVRIPDRELLDIDYNFSTLASLRSWLARVQRRHGRPADLYAGPDGTGAYPPRALPSESVQSMRAFKTLNYLSSSRRHNLLILGSSRVANLHSRVAAERGYRSLNFAVNRARAEDFWCILRFALDNAGEQLRQVVAGLDIDSFTNGLPCPEPALSRCPHLSAYLNEVPAAAADGESRVHDLWLRQQLESARQRILAYDPETGDQIFLNSDIHHSRHRTYISRPIESQYPVVAAQLAGYTGIGVERLAYFGQFARLCAERGLALTCFWSPVHAELARFMREHTPYAARRAEIEAYFAERLPEVPLHDFSVAAKFGGADDDFEDAAHIMPYNADVLLRRLLAGLSGADRSGA